MNRELRTRNKICVKKAYFQSDIERDGEASTTAQRGRKLNIENVNEKGIFFNFLITAQTFLHHSADIKICLYHVD